MSIEIAKSVTKNTAVLMGSQIVTWTSSFVLMMFLPRYLGSVEYGRLYLAISIVAIFLMVIDFGGRYAIAKEVARSKEAIPSIIVNSIGIRVLFWIGSMIILLTFALLAGYPPVVDIIIIIFGVEMLWEGARKVLWSCYQGLESMKYPSLGGIAERLFITIVGVTALLLGAKAVVIAIIMAVGTFLNFYIHVRFAPEIFRRRPKFDRKEALNLVKLGIPYFFHAVFGMIYYRIDSVMLSVMVPEAVLGWYGAAYRFFDILMFLPSLFSIAVFPVLSRLWKEEQSLALTTRKSLDFIFIAGIPVAVGVFAFAEQIVTFFYGLTEYASSIVVLKIFAFGLIFVYVDMIFVTALLATERQKQWVYVSLIAIFVNVGANFLLIPYTQTHFANGGIGAAIATLVTEIFVMVGALLLLPKYILKTSQITVAMKGIAAGVLMGATIWLGDYNNVPWFVMVVVSPLVYGGTLLGLRVLEPAEFEFLRSHITLRNLKRTFLPDKGPME